MPAHARAPPLSEVLRGPAPTPTADDRARNQQRLALWAGTATGLAWALLLWRTLLDLDRVPALEATLWSLGSGLVLGRGAFGGLRRLAGQWFGEVRVEVGPEDLAAFRHRVPRIVARRGYRKRHGGLHGEHYEHPWVHIVGPVRIAWAGAGARIEGPRWMVRRIVIQGVG